MSGTTNQKQVRVTENIRSEIQKLAEAYGLKQQQIVTLAVKSLDRQIHSDGGLKIQPKAPASQPPKLRPGHRSGKGKPQAVDKAKNRPTPGKTRGKPVQPPEPR